MTRFDLRWLTRHPLRWVRLMWLPWALAASLLAMAMISADPVFDVLVGGEFWPVILAMTAGVVATSALAPLEPRVQAVAAGTLFGVAALRLGTFAIAAATLDGAGRVLALDFVAHWFAIAAIAVHWPAFLAERGRQLSIASGQDDRAGG